MQERKVDLSSLIRRFNQRIFIDALASIEGPIDLVWDGKKMMRQLNLVVTPKLLTEHTNVAKNFSLDTIGGHKSADGNATVFLLYPTQRSVELLVKNWLKSMNEENVSNNHLFFIPEEAYTLTERLKEDENIWRRNSTVRSLPIHWFPSEQSSLITLDLPQLPAQVQVNGDWNFLFKCAKALHQMIAQCSKAPKFHCKGDWSARIIDILRKLPSPDAAGESSNATEIQGITDVVIIDRWLDPLTPLLRQFTFGGACDEFFGIDLRGVLKVPSDEFDELEESAEMRNRTGSSNELREIQLNDQVFEQLQDLSVGNVAFKLREIVDELKDEEQQRKTLASLAEYKNFVAKLPSVVIKRKSTGIFMRLAGVIQRRETDEFYRGVLKCEQEILKNPQQVDKVLPFIENALIEARDRNALMRLILLQALVARGLKPSVIQSYSKNIVQSYGIPALKWMLKLQLSGLLRDENYSTESRHLVRYYPIFNFAQLCKRYKLSPTEIDETRHSDVNTPSGRTSLLVKMIEEGFATNWNDFTTVEARMDLANEGSLIDREGDHHPPKKQTLIFVAGGITRAEVSMLNQIPQNILICTTALINGNNLLETFYE